MTIIKNTAYLANYQICVISPDVIELMRRCSINPIESSESTLKLFECYCHITGVRVDYLSLSSSFENIANGFLGALYDTSLVFTGDEQRRRYAIIFVRMIDSMKKEIPELKSLDGSVNNRKNNWPIWEAKKLFLDAKAVRYWNGWEVTSRKNKTHYLALSGLWNSHGPTFTEQYYRHIKLFYDKQAAAGFSEINKMAKYLSENGDEWPADTFYNPHRIKEFFLSFMKNHFMSVVKNKQNITSRIKSWNTFLSNMEEAFIQGGVWARPFGGGLPKPTAKTTPEPKSELSKNEDGVLVKEKLITTVPIEITDDEAIEFIFHSLEKDITTIIKWARRESYQLRKLQLHRIHLAADGIPSDDGAGLKTIEALGYKNICATFQRDGFKSDNKYLRRAYGLGTARTDISQFFGLPRAETLFPFQCQLVAMHPEITPGFLDKFELYNKHGQLSGFLKTDTGYQLIGYKDRRKKRLSEQKIDLTSRSAVLIRQIIEITQPLREVLKRDNNDTWRELFLTCSRSFSYPISANLPSWSHSKWKNSPSSFQILEQSFAPFTELRDQQLKVFLAGVSLSSLRASCGVLVYLKTKSVYEMSKALGHVRYEPSLLAHYLPEPILAFFHTRWIRIFQRGFICEAMKDSHYLIEATDFQSMEELHTFLKNHALKEIPEHLKNPDGVVCSTVNDKTPIFVSVDAGILTALMSLEKAVSTSKKANKICGKARYWAELSRTVVAEIQRTNDCLLQDHLILATQHLDPSRMEKLIYEPAS